MANELDGLIPKAYEALNVVSRERLGFMSAVSRSSSANRVGLNQEVTVPIVPSITLQDNTPAATSPGTGSMQFGSTTFKITKSKNAPILWNGEEELTLSGSGQLDDITSQQLEQAFRACANAIEADLASTYTGASRAYGTAGQAPFGTSGDLSDAAEVMRILEDNGANPSDLHLVLGSAAMAKIRGVQGVLFKVNEAGTDELLRRGVIGQLEGFNLHSSRFVAKHTKGTAASYLSDLLAGYAVNDTALHLDTGTGTHVAGDVITFAGDTAKYVIGTGAAGDGDKDIILNAPGLQATLANDVAATTGASYTANMAFAGSAIVLATRLPAMPSRGDGRRDTTVVTDPISGLSFEISFWGEYRQCHIEVAIAWGWNVIKPEHIAILLG